MRHGASAKEILIEACRRNNVELMQETLEGKSEAEQADLLNKTTTVMGNHLYHEAAARGNCTSSPLPPGALPTYNDTPIQHYYHYYDHHHHQNQNQNHHRPLTPTPPTDEIIDFLLDQENFECDPTNRLEGDTPLHSAVRWINSEPEAQREFGNALVDMMLEAGSNPRAKNKGGLTAYQLVDPRNTGLRDLIQKHEYAMLNKGDFVQSAGGMAAVSGGGAGGPVVTGAAALAGDLDGDGDADESDDDAEFSGSDDEERAEWDRRRKERAARKA
ncbi:hypothetical protein VSDG_05617 [Cytospora chrysosperma]|uniref:Uncharacterized protein n=1 Tax=Cytospora chrysosperma TaxID=252740 RepID=A0A423VZY8_CYTCH|nr:hypothetical protein VSDG_05617 [Valsa sordida]